MTHDVFLSYAREDLDAVRALVSAIEAEGLSVFWDRQIVPGQAWSDVLESAISESRAVVVVWSAASVKSTWVKAEATEAMARGKLVPLRIDNAAIPMPFGQVQTAQAIPGRPLREQGISVAAAIAALGTRHGDAPQPAAPGLDAATRDSGIVAWRHAFLSMSGRLGRRDFWICYLVLGSASALGLMLLEKMTGASARDAALAIKTEVMVSWYFMTLYFRIAILLKRLHDFGWSGWWVVPIGVIGLLQAAAVPAAHSAVEAERAIAWLLTGVVWAIVIFVGARRGQPGVNQYGMPHGGRT